MSRTLSARFVDTVSRPGRYGDGRGGHGLSLLVRRSASGGVSRTWSQRLTFRGAPLSMGLGVYPEVTLATARARALANRRRAAAGVDPRAPTATPTFEQAAERTLENLRPSWKDGAGYDQRWMGSLRQHVLPQIGHLPVDHIRVRDVLQVLEAVWTDHRDTARQVRRRIRAVLAWCQAHGYVVDNAAGEGIEGAIPVAPAVTRHHRALPYRDVPAALAAVERSKGPLAARLCFRFLVLTATRLGEARGARWSEVDTAERWWRIPAARMKRGVEFRQPLSGPAEAILARARTLDDGSGYVFPSPRHRGQCVGGSTLRDLLRDVGLLERTSLHGLRASFRTWAGDCTGADHVVMEECLSHRPGSAVELAYRRTDLLVKRRELMEAWAAYACGPTGGAHA